MREVAIESVRDAGAIYSVLAQGYGLDVRELRRIPRGQYTRNYRADCQERTVFVKAYAGNADLDAERDAVQLTLLAGEAGVPVAPLVLTCDGALIAVTAEAAVSVWGWVEGQ